MNEENRALPDSSSGPDQSGNSGPLPRTAKVGPLRLGAFKKTPEHLQAIERVQAWTRERFSLPQDAPVLASELACTVPGCPPLETVVAFWIESGERRHFKVFKPVEQVVEDDLPPAWLKDSLCSIEGEGFSCC
jgi:nitrate reductase delta subunit